MARATFGITRMKVAQNPTFSADETKSGWSVGGNGTSKRNGTGAMTLNGEPVGEASPSAGLLFFRSFLRYPGKVGWVLPSSKFLVEEVLRQVDWEAARVIVEYGPGVGTFTARMLQRMRPDARLIALEINPDFVQFLRRTLRDPRLHVLQESAERVDAILGRLGCDVADYVVSGIPFKTLSHPLREAIVRKTHSILRPGGNFLVYQFSGAVLPYLEEVFPRVIRDREILNLVPTRLFYCER